MLSPPQVLIASPTSAINVVASIGDEDVDHSDKETGPLDHLELDSEQNTVSLLGNCNFIAFVLYRKYNLVLHKILF